MGLIDRIFGNGRDREPTGTTQFQESEPASSEDEGSRNAPRRELVQVVLRDTMRRHGVPSDWVECRILSTVKRTGRHGLHVNFVVKKAHERLLVYVFAFQDSFERELARFDPRARDWLLSLGWEFQGFDAADMPDPHTWTQSGPAPLVNADWRAPESGFGNTQQPVDDETPRSDEGVQRDLRALFAIRDAALAQTRPAPEDDAPNDFQPTQPFEDPRDVKK